MKTAYSLFLHEYVDPASIEYEDSRTFQIVCAVCKEPVFKVARDNKGKTTHYFSHYKKDETLNSQCELRANRITNNKIDEVRKESRNQKLNLFLKVFQDIVRENEYDEIGKRKAKQYFFQLGGSQVLSTWLRVLLQGFRREMEDKENVLDMFDESLENIHGNETDFTSTYALNLRKEFAFDFFQYLLAGHSKTNFFFLLKHAYIKVLESFEKKRKETELLPWEEEMFNCMRKFLKTNNENKRMELFNRMDEYKMISPYTHQEVDLHIMFGSYLQYHAFGILLRIPYFRLLKQNFNRKEVGKFDSSHL